MRHILLIAAIFAATSLQAQEQPKDTTIAVTLNLNQFRALLFEIDRNIDSKKASKELIDFLQQNARIVNPTTDWEKKAKEIQKDIEKLKPKN